MGKRMDDKILEGLYHGDCLEVMKRIPDAYVDMVLCDLPYGMTQNKWDVIIPFDKLWERYNRVVKENGAILLFAQGIFLAKLILSNEKYYKYKIVWHKSIKVGFLNAKKQPLRQHEDILVFYRKQPTYNPQFTKGKPYINKSKSRTSNYGHFNSMLRINRTGDRYPVDIIGDKDLNKTNCEKRKHPTQKPVALLENLIKQYSNECDVILDNAMGVGSTGIACVNTNRNFIGIELNKEYYDFAVENIEEARLKCN